MLIAHARHGEFVLRVEEEDHSVEIRVPSTATLDELAAEVAKAQSVRDMAAAFFGDPS